MTCRSLICLLIVQRCARLQRHLLLRGRVPFSLANCPSGRLLSPVGRTAHSARRSSVSRQGWRSSLCRTRSSSCSIVHFVDKWSRFSGFWPLRRRRLIVVSRTRRRRARCGTGCPIVIIHRARGSLTRTRLFLTMIIINQTRRLCMPSGRSRRLVIIVHRTRRRRPMRLRLSAEYRFLCFFIGQRLHLPIL